MKKTALNNKSSLPRLLGALAVLAVTSLSGSVHSEEAVPPINSARETLEQWVETKRIASQERRDLELSKEILGERIRMVQREIDALKAKIKDAEGSISDADKKRAELLAQNEALKAATVSLQTRLAAMEQGIADLLKRLPEPIRERIKPLTQRLPQDAEAAAKLSLSERFQNVVGILNEVEKFNSEITMTSEVRQLPDGASAEVTAVYLGISQGYYVGRGGTIAGIGRPTPEGWTWTPADASAPAIADVVAILKNEKVASFVQIPVTVD